MNNADSNVTDMNIHHITYVFRRFLWHSSKIVFVFSALDHSPNPRMIWILTTIPILLRRLQWWIAVALLLFEGSQRVAPFYHEVLPRSQWIALFHRARSSHERILIGTRVSLPNRRQKVAPFYHPSIYQLSTLEKTKLCHHPTLSSVLRRNFP